MLNLKNRNLFGLLAIFLMCSCQQTSSDSQQVSQTITDMLGRTIQVPVKVDRVVAIRAGALRQVVYMGGASKVVGVEETEKKYSKPYTLAYPELKELPSIGPAMGGDAEMIMTVRPDVIFMAYTTSGDAQALQDKTGIPVLVVACPELGTERDTLYASFRMIGKTLGNPGRADTLIAGIEACIYELGVRSSGVHVNKKPKVYIGGVPYSGAHGIQATQPYYPPFLFNRARYVTADLDPRLISHVKGTFIDKEQLLLWDPDILFVDVSGLDLVKQDIQLGGVFYNQLSCLQKGNIHILLPYNNYATNYELVLLNAWYVGSVLYPHNYNDISLNHKADQMLELFYGKPITRDNVLQGPVLKKYEILP